MDVFQNMELFSELIQCGGNIYTWCYNADGSLLQSNCPEAGFLSGAFEIFGCKKKMLDYGSRHTTPVTLGTAIGMTWAAAFEKDGSVLKRAWVIGPVFYQDVSLRGIEQGLQYYNRLETSVAWTMQLYEALKTVPVLQCTVLHRYALMMLAFNITNEFYRDLNSVGTVTAMRNAAHGTLYALANSFAVTRAVSVPKWVKTTYAVDAVVAIILVAWEICAIRKYRKAKKEDEDTEQ